MRNEPPDHFVIQEKIMDIGRGYIVSQGNNKCQEENYDDDME